MPSHRVVSPEEWLAERLALLDRSADKADQRLSHGQTKEEQRDRNG